MSGTLSVRAMARNRGRPGTDAPLLRSLARCDAVAALPPFPMMKINRPSARAWSRTDSIRLRSSARSFSRTGWSSARYRDTFTECRLLLTRTLRGLALPAAGQQPHRGAEQDLDIEPDRVVPDVEETPVHLLGEGGRRMNGPWPRQARPDSEEARQPDGIRRTVFKLDGTRPDETHPPKEHAGEQRPPVDTQPGDQLLCTRLPGGVQHERGEGPALAAQEPRATEWPD